MKICRAICRRINEFNKMVALLLGGGDISLMGSTVRFLPLNPLPFGTMASKIIFLKHSCFFTYVYILCAPLWEYTGYYVVIVVIYIACQNVGISWTHCLYAISSIATDFNLRIWVNYINLNNNKRRIGISMCHPWKFWKNKLNTKERKTYSIKKRTPDMPILWVSPILEEKKKEKNRIWTLTSLRGVPYDHCTISHFWAWAYKYIFNYLLENIAFLYMI